MAIYVGIGTSNDIDSAQAGYGAYKSAVSKIGENTPNLIILFASSNFNQKELIHGIRQAGGIMMLVGCSSAGEITNSGVGVKSAAVMVISSDSIGFYSGLGKGVEADPRKAGFDAANEIKENSGDSLKSIIIFPDILSGNASEIIRGVFESLGEGIPIVGGAAGDDFLFNKTYQYCNNDIVSDSVSALGLSGNFTMGVGVKHGWMPIGIPMVATKSRGTILYELDNRPAIKLYEEYFGMSSEDLLKDVLAKLAIRYPLGVKLPYMEEYLVISPLTVEEKGSVKCSTGILEGSEVRLMIGSKEKASIASEEAALSLMRDFEKKHKKPSFVLMFSSVARSKLFGREEEGEIRRVMSVIGKEVPLFGFYTYGEIAPIKNFFSKEKNNFSKFYNETITLFGIGE